MNFYHVLNHSMESPPTRFIISFHSGFVVLHKIRDADVLGNPLDTEAGVECATLVMVAT